MKKKYGSRAAEPGTSLHEFGLAVDVDSKTLDDMDKLGLLRKYGFVRPVGQEPWHLEPIGTQDNLSLYKKDQTAATQAILAGAGKGGGGLGTIRTAAKSSRNRDLSMSIMNASVEEKDPSTLVAAAAASKTTLPGADGGRPAIGFAPKTAAGAQALPAVVPVAGGTGIATAAATAGASGSAFTKAGRALIAASNDAEFGVSKSSGAPIKSISNDPTFKVPDPKGSGIDGLRDTILGAAKMVGVDGNMMLTTAAVESDFNPNAQARTSTAKGLYQPLQGTWGEWIGKWGKQYGYTLANTSPTDAKANAILAAHYFKENLANLQRSTKRSLGTTDAYMTHFMGPSGAAKFLAAMDANPNAIGSQLFAKPASDNPDLFFENGQPLTLQAIYAKIGQRIQAKAKTYGLDVPASVTPTLAAATPATTDSTQASIPGFIPRKAPTVVAGNDATTSPPVRPITTAGLGISSRAMGPSFVNPPNASMSQPQTAAIHPDLLKSTEGLLTQQLDVQTKMLGTLQQIASNLGPKDDKSAPAPDAKAAQPPPVYTQPEPPVSMGRQRYGNA